MMTQADMAILESEMAFHLYDKFATEVMSGHIPEDMGARLTAEMRRWREASSLMDVLPVNIAGTFQCRIDFSYPPSSSDPPTPPPRFVVRFVFEDPPLWGWDEDPLEL